MINQDLTLFGAKLVNILTGDWAPRPVNFGDDNTTQIYGSRVGLSMYKHITGEVSGRGSNDCGLRISQLGKPAVIQACSLPHITEELRTLGFDTQEKKNLRMLELLHRGDQWEEWVIALSCIQGYPPRQPQQMVEFMGVTGHIDFVLDLGSGPVLVEVKTMSGNYFNQFTKRPNDDRGYLTQLTCYSKALGLPGVWLCLDKSTHNVAVVQHPGEEAAQKVEERLSRIIPKLQSVGCLKDVFDQFVPPPAVSEIYQRKETGRFLVPPSMRWSPLRHIFYQLSVESNGYGKNTEYVVGVNNYDQATEFLKSCVQLSTP